MLQYRFQWSNKQTSKLTLRNRWYAAVSRKQQQAKCKMKNKEGTMMTTKV